MTAPNAPMSAEETLERLGRIANTEGTLYLSVAAMAEREAALVNACAVKDRVGKDLTAARDELLAVNAKLVAERDALASRHAATERDACLQAERANELESRVSALVKEVEALREDAERWRHARMLLTVDEIEGAQRDYESFGRLVSEEECKRADAAIDAARAEARDG